MENSPDKLLVYTAIIDRPRTTEKFFEYFVQHTNLPAIYWVIVDNNSNSATKQVIKEYEWAYNELIENPFNYGPTFSVNQVLAKRLPGQHFLCTNADAFIMNHDWQELMMHFVNMEWTGIVSGRRPNLWTEPGPGSRLQYFLNAVQIKEVDGYVVESPDDNSVIFPWCIVKSDILDKIGYMDESLNVDDSDYSHRVSALGLQNIYIPDVCILQYHNEEQNHPEYHAYRELVVRSMPRVMETDYSQIKFCGTRFKPESITNQAYLDASNEHFTFFKNYQRIVKERQRRRDTMKIDSKVEEMITKGEKIRLDIGAGHHKEPGFVTLDKAEACKPDIVCDLDIDGIPLPDSSVIELRAIAVLEHCRDSLAMINEIWRVCANDAKVLITLPHSGNDRAWVDPTHKSFFSERSPSYWDRRSGHYTTPNAGSDYGVKAMFKNIKVMVELDEEIAQMAPDEQRFAIKFFRNSIVGMTVELVVEK